MWHVSSRSGVTTSRTGIHLLLTYLSWKNNWQYVGNGKSRDGRRRSLTQEVIRATEFRHLRLLPFCGRIAAVLYVIQAQIHHSSILTLDLAEIWQKKRREIIRTTVAICSCVQSTVPRSFCDPHVLLEAAASAVSRPCPPVVLVLNYRSQIDWMWTHAPPASSQDHANTPVRAG